MPSAIKVVLVILVAIVPAIMALNLRASGLEEVQQASDQLEEGWLDSRILYTDTDYDKSGGRKGWKDDCDDDDDDDDDADARRLFTTDYDRSGGRKGGKSGCAKKYTTSSDDDQSWKGKKCGRHGGARILYTDTDYDKSGGRKGWRDDCDDDDD